MDNLLRKGRELLSSVSGVDIERKVCGLLQLCVNGMCKHCSCIPWMLSLSIALHLIDSQGYVLSYLGPVWAGKAAVNFHLQTIFFFSPSSCNIYSIDLA